MGTLTHEQILELHAAAIAARLGNSRSALLANIHPGFVAGLQVLAAPSEQLLCDLSALNEAGALVDGSVPLVAWLKSAIALAGPRTEAATFQRALEQFVAALNRAPSPRSSSEPAIDFAILTAIEVERQAVCEAFGLGDETRVQRGSRVYWRGRLPLEKGGAYELVVAQATDMANVDAAILATDTLHHWSPGAALLVGIAAAAHKDVRLGDVVLGSAVYYYERGKVTPDGLKPEPQIIPADATLWNNASAAPAWDGAVNVERPDETMNRPKIHKGVIASGEKVIAHAAARDAVAAGHRKILAIEMEGYGFSRALWQSFERVRHLVIRGISDDGSITKDDRWHRYAAAAAGSFTRHLLLDQPLEPQTSAHQR